MRRSILVAVLAGALVGLAVAAGISLAGSSGSSGSSSSSSEHASTGGGSFASAYAAKQGKRRGGRRGGHPGPHGLGFGPMGLAFLMWDMGMKPGAQVEVVRRAPFNGPLIVRVRDEEHPLGDESLFVSLGRSGVPDPCRRNQDDPDHAHSG